eukprot:3809563-Rhodomonas_salina.2
MIGKILPSRTALASFHRSPLVCLVASYSGFSTGAAMLIRVGPYPSVSTSEAMLIHLESYPGTSCAVAPTRRTIGTNLRGVPSGFTSGTATIRYVSTARAATAIRDVSTARAATTIRYVSTGHPIAHA